MKVDKFVKEYKNVFNSYLNELDKYKMKNLSELESNMDENIVVEYEKFNKLLIDKKFADDLFKSMTFEELCELEEFIKDHRHKVIEILSKNPQVIEYKKSNTKEGY